MKRFALLCVALTSSAAVFGQVTVGQTDTFNSNIQSWNGAQPLWQPNGGPTGTGDGYLQMQSLGGVGQYSKMAMFNLDQWRGNYLAAGIGSISVDFENFGTAELDMRMVFFDITTSTQWVSNFSAVLPGTPGWHHFSFAIGESLFTQTEGTTSFADTLTNPNRLMFRHNPGAPSNGGVSLAATLGVDNIRANAVPEPATMGALGLGLAFLRRRRTRA